jgi:DDE family transposase
MVIPGVKSRRGPHRRRPAKPHTDKADPRHRRGVRHPIVAIPGLAAAAVAPGCRSFIAIGEWAADAPQSVLRAVGARFDPRRNRFVAPDEATLFRQPERDDQIARRTAKRSQGGRYKGCGNGLGDRSGSAAVKRQAATTPVG